LKQMLWLFPLLVTLLIPRVWATNAIRPPITKLISSSLSIFPWIFQIEWVMLDLNPSGKVTKS
jgi:hypothetical protein